ncbi:uncharacterized protein PITG_08154 [Phytophthora infestans T30-4]|uniref:Uncharacterized protein n=1 Tax=Phytophthora infestans (strain T30-4) TaxID=403677 RepID=D0N9K7_PHYIT|nr:uncharacterized protein PITG_08154 [Phytophthora infestans T30-4]EEY54495.1 conserved hypothetical protein [Phytophthora infestans T30-4]|eukprot:XP_002904317.1 conserved hypothetical protein [Phytophthora infestans T30-4]
MKSNGRSLSRRQARLPEQRLLLSRRPRRQELESEMKDQWRVKEQSANRVDCWWNSDGDDGVTRPDNTCLNKYYDHCETSDAAALRPEVTSNGSSRRSTTNAFTTTESWKTLVLKKACNRALVRRSLLLKSSSCNPARNTDSSFVGRRRRRQLTGPAVNVSGGGSRDRRSHCTVHSAPTAAVGATDTGFDVYVTAPVPPKRGCAVSCGPVRGRVEQ